MSTSSSSLSLYVSPEGAESSIEVPPGTTITIVWTGQREQAQIAIFRDYAGDGPAYLLFGEPRDGMYYITKSGTECTIQSDAPEGEYYIFVSDDAASALRSMSQKIMRGKINVKKTGIGYEEGPGTIPVDQ